MGSPFPGVDPFLEGQGVWHDFHVSFNICLRKHLMPRLPKTYVARIEEHVYLDDDSGTTISRKMPDVEVEKTSNPRREAPAMSQAVLTLEPIVVPNRFVDPIRVRYIKVRTRSDDQVVTVIETLSPTNKYGSGRNEYLSKRMALMYEDVHLVELDLLLRGRRIEMAEPIPSGDFFAMISRGNRRPDCEVYPWNLPVALPAIPIPLKAPDPDVKVDLQEVFAAAFELGPYDELVRYDRPVGMTLSEKMRDWVAERLRGYVV